MKPCLIAASVSLLFCSTLPVSAEQTGFYVGASAGYADLDEDRADVVRSLTEAGFAATARVDDTDFAWKVFGGYNINAWFAVEAGYVDLGEVEGDFDITAPVAGSGSA